MRLNSCVNGASFGFPTLSAIRSDNGKIPVNYEVTAMIDGRKLTFSRSRAQFTCATEEEAEQIANEFIESLRKAKQIAKDDINTLSWNHLLDWVNTTNFFVR